ncbi:hypothetical protein SARC_11391 [Sphaeroforma arctica JP610]|uniref:t-SNARE coiled-coil homology domain-containing protein n=1 Tax=Sphaeroforma arctica JP610 TaxID=667725 RepID=A0A0L0FH55_9EUKA|nr:hypothetical protein SARC_11391 [Sphaeroforma arctica JP610]KNC76097.1 hypothetical protein SARC_11391 [Sphaeroforma arctica JP610]|eukprot:XP_014149999.1 hypothetical protein SARC_11391 [Sphaeroforma arctica JP610]
MFKYATILLVAVAAVHAQEPMESDIMLPYPEESDTMGSDMRRRFADLEDLDIEMADLEMEAEEVQAPRIELVKNTDIDALKTRVDNLADSAEAYAGYSFVAGLALGAAVTGSVAIATSCIYSRQSTKNEDFRLA